MPIRRFHWLSRILSKAKRMIELKNTPKVTTEWIQRIKSVNNQLLLQVSSSQEPSLNGIFRQTNWNFKDNGSWKTTLSVLGAEWSHRVTNSPNDFMVLKNFYDSNIDRDGKWVNPIKQVDQAMKGYSLLYLAELTKDNRYRIAVDHLAKFLLIEHPRTSDGSLPYHPWGSIIFVDTLGMICPFLAKYANHFESPEAMQLGVTQLVQFIHKNVDKNTHLPYHGYYAEGPKRLGLHAWGRGTGWYMLGLIDTLLEMNKEHPHYTSLLQAYVNAAQTLKKFQRADGHWTWAILHMGDKYDSSTTSIIGYSILRAIQAGILDISYKKMVLEALRALISVTQADGLLDGALGESQGLGKYPQNFGPEPWLQGSATAFVCLFEKGSKN